MPELRPQVVVSTMVAVLRRSSPGTGVAVVGIALRARTSMLAGVLVAINYPVGVLAMRSKRAEEIVEGRPQVLIHDGVLFEDVRTRVHFTRHELGTAPRQHGGTQFEDVRLAVLEDNGAISVIPFIDAGKRGLAGR